MATPGQTTYWLGNDYLNVYGATGPTGPAGPATVSSVASGTVDSATPLRSYSILSPVGVAKLYYISATVSVWTNGQSFIRFQAIDDATSFVLNESCIMYQGVANQTEPYVLTLPFKTQGSFSIAVASGNTAGGTNPTCTYTIYEKL